MPGAVVQAGDWLSQYSDEPEKVREFCIRHGVLDQLRIAVELARRDFPPIKELTVSLWTDPLEKTEMVRMYITAQSGFDEARAGYWRFLGEWTQAVPLPERDLIHISYICT